MDPSQIKPLGDRVLVETVTDDEMTRGGILIPDIVREGRPEKARVLAVGPGLRDPKTGERMALDFAPGDLVIFHRHSGTHIGGLDDSYIVFREHDILAKIDE